MKLRAGVDWSFLALSLRERRAFFMIGDWGHRAALLPIIARILIRAPVAIWTDTPQEGLPRPLVKRWLRKVLLKCLLAQVDTVFASGSPGIKAVKSMGAKENKIVNLPVFVDLDRPSRRKATRDQGEGSTLSRGGHVGATSCIFAMVGTMIERKGHDVGISAFARCVSRVGGELRLVIAGEGPERLQLEQFAKDLGVSRSIEFLGWQEPEQMDAVYMAADVIVHPARWDPFPLIVLEGMSWGKVVIASDVCGSAIDRIQHGRNGFMFNQGNVDELSEIMVRVSEDEVLRRNVGEAARKTAEEWPISRGVDTIISNAELVVGKRF
jgi:glycosyltransferase involved in cell wall biosynthesis